MQGGQKFPATSHYEATSGDTGKRAAGLIKLVTKENAKRIMGCHSRRPYEAFVRAP
jgi:hypothetical protein